MTRFLYLRLVRIASIILAVLLGAAAPGAFGQANVDRGPVERVRQLDRMIDGLASHNIRPRMVTGEDDWKDVLFPERFDWADQKRVAAAAKRIAEDESNDLWPRLIEHLGDERYSVTGGFDLADPWTYSVGDLCRQLAYNQLLCAYLKNLLPGGTMPMGGDSPNWVPDGTNEFLPRDLQKELHSPPQLGYQYGKPDGGDKLKAWYLTRRGKPLYKLQIEMCEWALSTVEHDSRSAAAPKKVFLDRVKNQINLLKADKKPVADSVCGSPLNPDFWEFFSAISAKDERNGDHTQTNTGKLNANKRGEAHPR